MAKDPVKEAEKKARRLKKTALHVRLQDIRNHPERHQHDEATLQACNMIEGEVQKQLVQAHERIKPIIHPKKGEGTS
jgi:hypothetical protein